MKDFSYVTSSHPAYIESLYNDYTKDPSAVDPEWEKFFEGFDFAVTKVNGNGSHIATAGGKDIAAVSNETLAKEFGVFKMIRAYRKRAHLIADTNPIRQRKDRRPELDLKYFDLDETDLNT